MSDQNHIFTFIILPDLSLKSDGEIAGCAQTIELKAQFDAMPHSVPHDVPIQSAWRRARFVVRGQTGAN
jgi:hypothetical protein